MANGFVEVSGYSKTDLDNARAAGYNECKEDLTTLTVEENGTYVAEDQGVVGWDRVEVEAQADLFHRLITANGDYDAEEDGHQGYSSVTVAVPGGGGGGPFTVRFFADDRQTILKTDANVPYGGTAECTSLDGTILNGLYFKGWNPSPVNVREDMNCYPMRGDYVIDANEIQDSWETICADCGAHYSLGSYKSLVLNGVTIPSVTVPITFYGNRGYQYTYPATTCTVAFHMVKVAEGEDGTTSTWVSSAGFTCTGTSDSWADWTWYGNTQAHWKDSGIRGWLNAAVIQILPQILQDTIKPVTKVSQIYNGGWMDQETIDKIWVPSMKEFGALADTCNNSSLNTLRRETSGIDYSQIYVPNLNTIFTRTEAGQEAAPIATIDKVNLLLKRRHFTAFGSNPTGDGYQIGFCL